MKSVNVSFAHCFPFCCSSTLGLLLVSSPLETPSPLGDLQPFTTCSPVPTSLPSHLSSPPMTYTPMTRYLDRYLNLCLHPTTTYLQVAKGLRHLQAALGLPETGLEGEQERQVVKRGKCVNDNSPKKEHVVSSQSGVTFPKASSVEIFETDKANSVNFEEAPARKLGVILPSRNDRFCHQGVRVKRCRQKTNQPCRWFCKKKKKTVQWSSLITEQPQKLLKLASMQK